VLAAIAYVVIDEPKDVERFEKCIVVVVELE
jgi:hypothetical protein